MVEHGAKKLPENQSGLNVKSENNELFSQETHKELAAYIPKENPTKLVEATPNGNLKETPPAKRKITVRAIETPSPIPPSQTDGKQKVGIIHFYKYVCYSFN